MRDDNKKNQSSIYSDYFNIEKIHYDNFLLPPNDYIREKYFDSIPPESGARVLEIGIGISSFLVRATRKHKISPFGFDYVDSSLRAQNNNSPLELKLCRGDAENLPYKDNTFDITVAISVIEHLSDFDKTLREINRVLRPGGKLLVQMPCKDFRFSLFGKLQSYQNIKDKEWFKTLEKESGHDFSRIPDRYGWRKFIVQNNFFISYLHATDIFIDSWMMYTFFEWIKNMQSKIIRKKSGPIPKISTPTETNTEEINKIQGPNRKEYSSKRKIAGLIWYHIVLKLFRILFLIEQSLRSLPVGASIYIKAIKLK